MNLPASVLACPATLALILRAQCGQLPRASYYAAWEALEVPDAYQPSEELEDWMREHWHDLVSEREQVVLVDKNLETLDLARVWAREWMPKLLVAYAEAGGVMTEACKVINRSDETVRLWYHRDAHFKAALDAADKQVDDRVRTVIRNHAIEGVEEPVFGMLPGKGAGEGEIGRIVKFDHRLLIRYAEARLPEYSRKGEGTTVNVSATATASTSTTITVPPEKIADLQAREQRRLEKRLDRESRLKASGNN